MLHLGLLFVAIESWFHGLSRHGVFFLVCAMPLAAYLLYRVATSRIK